MPLSIALQQPEIICNIILFVFYTMTTYFICFLLADRYAGRMGFLLLWICNWIVLFLCAFGLVYHVILCHTEAYLEWLTLTLPYLLPIHLGIIADVLSVKMACLVLFISFCVQLFSFHYMRSESRFIQFMVILHVFTFFMLLFVFSSTLLQAFVAWEGLGFVSFALINFWSARDEANKAAFKAIIFNRFADVWFIMAIIVCLFYFNTVDFHVLNAISCCSEITVFVPWFGSVTAVSFIACSIFLAAIGKSAQLGYHVWLTAAMEGPSPVSALLHSATMVTAGVFLVLRCQDIFNYSSPVLLSVIIFIGITTCFFCGWFAFIALDFKRVIAYSTCSHLGLMFSIIGFNFLEVAELHVHVHAFFKTTLFLCAGLVMSVMLHLQNFRKISSFAIFLPICYSLLSFSTISLLGFPCTIGSMSKERFVMLAFVNADAAFILRIHFVASVIALVTALLYSIRLMLNIAYQPGFNGERRFTFFLESESSGVWFSQFLLCVGVIVLCYLSAMLLIRGLIALDPWNWLNPYFEFYGISSNSIPIFLRFFVAIFVGVFCICYKLFSRPCYRFLRGSVVFIGGKLLVPLNLILTLLNVPDHINFIVTIFNNFESYLSRIYYGIIKLYLKLSYELFVAWERGVIEIIGPIGLVRIIREYLIYIISRGRTGNIVEYIYEIVVTIILVLFSVFSILCCNDLSLLVPIVFFIIVSLMLP